MSHIEIQNSKAIINGVEYQLGMSLRVQVLYEKMLSAVDQNQSTLRTIVYFYAVLMGLNPESFKMEFDEFFNLLNEQPHLYKDFLEWLRQDRSPLSYFEAPTEEPKETDDKKKD